MTRSGGGDTINQGPAPARPDEAGGQAAGNARLKDEDPSPDDRERGETSSADEPAARDLDAIRERTG
jgi:hypothetical protein